MVLKGRHVSSNWLFEYRCCQVISRQVNNCLGQYLLPMHMSQIIFFAIVTIYVALRLAGDLAFKIGLAFTLALIVIFFSLWKYGTVFRDISAEAVRVQRLRCGSKYSKKVLNSCQVMRIDIGNYFKLTERVILRSYAAIVERSISLLML